MSTRCRHVSNILVLSRLCQYLAMPVSYIEGTVVLTRLLMQQEILVSMPST